VIAAPLERWSVVSSDDVDWTAWRSTKGTARKDRDQAAQDRDPFAGWAE